MSGHYEGILSLHIKFFDQLTSQLGNVISIYGAIFISFHNAFADLQKIQMINFENLVPIKRLPLYIYSESSVPRISGPSPFASFPDKRICSYTVDPI